MGAGGSSKQPLYEEVIDICPRLSTASWYVLRDTWHVRPRFSLYFGILTNGCMTSEIRGLSCVLTYSLPLVFVPLANAFYFLIPPNDKVGCITVTLAFLASFS